MKAVLENISTLEEYPSQTKRKLSMFQQYASEWEQSIDMGDLKKIGNFISSNIQSQRKNILDLYSTSYSALQKKSNPILPQLLSPIVKSSLRKKSIKDTIQVLSPIKKTHLQDVQIDNFIISSNFPSKIIKPTEKLKVQPPIRRLSPKKATRKLPLEPSLLSVEQKQDKIYHPIPKQILRKKLPKLLKQKRQEQDTLELNPWQYLKIQDQPIFGIFL